MEDRLEHPETVGTGRDGVEGFSTVECVFLCYQLFSVTSFAGGNGAVDSVPHLLLGGADWTESEEDLRLVGEVLHQVVGFKCSLVLKMSQIIRTRLYLYEQFPLRHMKTKMNLLISCSYSFHTQTFAYPESSAEREEILQGLQSRIEDIKSVSVNMNILCGFLTDERF